MKQTFYSNGKLLITGEYVVLDGVQALALPTKFGQSLEVTPIKEAKILWKSYDSEGAIWLKTEIAIEEISSFQKNKKKTYSKEVIQLISILQEAQKLNPDFLNNASGFKVCTYLDFPRNWGLGSSSTLINNIATWANINAFTLLKNTFGGSGYDIASAKKNKPILYSITNYKPQFEEIDLKWNFTEQLFFIHLIKKQNSREAIKNYNLHNDNSATLKDRINHLTLEIVSCNTLSHFEKLITEHEQIISKISKQKPIKELLFKDYHRSIKSLGAWGGDFILATGDEKNRDYFRKKGYNTLVSFKEMIL